MANIDKTIAAYRSQIDHYSHALKTITTEHAISHLGGMFVVGQKAQALAANGTLLFEIITHESHELHLKEAEIFCTETPHLIELIEAPTLTTGVTALTPICTEREFAYSAFSTWKSNPTSISAGTLLTEYYVGGGTGIGVSKASSASQSLNEFELKADTTYLLRLTNKSANAASVSVRLFFYEE